MKQDSLEKRAVEVISDEYPITREELRRRLGVSGARLDLALKRLEKMGYIEYDVLPDKTYIRLKRVPVGREARRRKGKRDRKGRGGNGEDYDFSYV